MGKPEEVTQKMKAAAKPALQQDARIVQVVKGALLKNMSALDALQFTQGAFFDSLREKYNRQECPDPNQVDVVDNITSALIELAKAGL